MEEDEENVKNKMLTCKILNNPELVAFFRSVFDCCDTNKDGFVSINELKNFLENQEEVVIPENVLDSIYSKFDKNKDKQLDFEEFLEMINNKTIKETFQIAADRILKFVVIPPKDCKATLRRTITVTGSYEREIRCNTNIVGMVVISLIQLICFYSNEAYRTVYNNGPLFNALAFDLCKRKNVYPYFSYLFLHYDNQHLYGNLIIQIIIGIPLEMVHSWRVTIIYVMGAFGGALTHSVLDREADLVGGSGGVFAFFTAHISVVIMNWREMSHPAVHLLLFGVVVVIDVIYNIVTRGGENDMTSYWCHAGGTVIGLLFGVNILRNIRVTKRENIIWYICFVTLAVLLIIFISLDVVLPVKKICE